MANDIQNKTATVYIDDAPARDAYDRLSAKADDYNKKLAEGTKKAELLSKQIKKSLDAGGNPTAAIARLEKLNTTIDKQKEGLAKVVSQQKALQGQMDNKTGPSLRSQEAFVRKLWNEYRNLGENTEEAKQKLEQYIVAGRKLDDMRDRMNGVRKAQDAAGKSSSMFFASFAGNLAVNAVNQVSSLVENFFGDAVDEALQADLATRRFHATLDNLGRTDAFDRLTSKADEMAEKFSYLDNDDVVGVFNKLVDYGKLTEKQMNDLLPVIINFAAKQRISLEESTSVIVKALEGSGRAMKDYGIEVKESNSDVDNFNAVMTTLKEKVDGAAEAFQESAEGGIAQARQELANTKEEIGTNLIPVLSTLYGWLNKLLIGWGQLRTTASEFGSDIAAYFKGGMQGVVDNITKRNAEREARLEAKSAADYVASFQEKTTEEITAAIIERQQQLAGKQQLALAKFMDKETKEKAASAVRVLKAEIDGLLKLQDGLSNKETLGINDNAEVDKKAAEEAKRRADEAAKRRKQENDRILADQKKLQQDLQKIALSLLPEGVGTQVVLLQEKYNEMRQLAHGNQQLLLQAEEFYQKELQVIIQKYSAAAGEIARKQTAAEIAEQERKLKSLQRLATVYVSQTQKDLSNALKEGTAKRNADILAQYEMRLQQANDFQKLARYKDLLEVQRAQAIASANETGASVEDIEKGYRDKKREAEFQFYTALLSEVLSYAQQVADIFAMSDQVKTNKENAELAKQQKKNEKEKAGYQALLNKKLISQQEYNRRAKDLDDAYRAQEAAAKKKQFERQQKADIIAARISGAQAILSALQTKPFLLGLALAVLAGIKTDKQIDVIKSQPVPEFAMGGLLNGPSHSQGGMPVINPRTGKKEAEVEGGEVILSRKTVRNNPEIVGDLLHSSMRRQGARIEPRLQSRPYKSFDYTGMSDSIKNTRYYANGGTFPGNNTTEAVKEEPQTIIVPAMSESQEALMQALLTRLSSPIKAYTLLSDHQAAADELAEIKNEAIFRKQ